MGLRIFGIGSFCHLFSYISIIVFFSNPALSQTEGNIIHNSREGHWGKDPEVIIEPAGTFGNLEGEDENYLFYLPKDITGDRDGNIYVLDSGSNRIQKYDKDRNFLATIGKAGQGPAEFNMTESFEVDFNGNIYVYEFGNRRVQVISPEGKCLKTFRVKETNMIFRFFRSGEILLRNPNLDGGRGLKKNDVPLFRILDKDFKTKRKFGQGVFFRKFPRSTGGNRLLFTTDDKEYIYVTFLFQNRIEKYSPSGSRIFKADRYLTSEIVKDSDEGMSLHKNSEGIDVDNKGRIWILTPTRKTNKKEEVYTHTRMSGSRSAPVISTVIHGNTDLTETDMYCLELFSNSGILLYRYPLKHFCDGLKIIDDRIYILDRLRGMRFYIYNIIENK